MSKPITVPATISKDQLTAGRKLYGLVNDRTLTIGEQSFDIGRLRYVSFIGQLDSKAQLLTGEHVFEAVEADPAAERGDIGQVLKLDPPAPSKTANPRQIQVPKQEWNAVDRGIVNAIDGGDLNTPHVKDD